MDPTESTSVNQIEPTTKKFAETTPYAKFRANLFTGASQQMCEIQRKFCLHLSFMGCQQNGSAICVANSSLMQKSFEFGFKINSKLSTLSD